MKTIEIEVVSQFDSRDRPKARLAVCDCGCSMFVSFQIEGDDHGHLQCVDCGLSYCEDGTCKQRRAAVGMGSEVRQ